VTKPLVGQRLGPYEIGSLLGSGGMGEVYRARDTKLGRDVAIKILPASLTADADRRARFEREARTLAALNHPHIGAIYGFEDRDGVHALVLELVEGQTLAERLARSEHRALRPIPIGDALAIARQIADALDAAHEKGIVHRDLKPANIILLADGRVKVVDFGLAKRGADDAAPNATESPTIAAAATHGGMVLGTAPYMSPEQARGQAVDKRTDIWAFGCVLYELLTGRQAFAGETVSDTIAAILDREPDWPQLPASTPSVIRRLLQRCLEKDPKRRLRDIGDARFDIDDATEQPTTSRAAIASTRDATRRVLRWMLPALVAIGVAAALALRFAPSAPLRDVTRFTVPMPQTLQLIDMMALSPDGRALVYTGVDDGGRRLYKRTVDTIESVPIRGAEGGSHPFFSPDGVSVGFVANGDLKRIPLDGGDATTVAKNVDRLSGGAWLSDGTIVFASPNKGLSRVPVTGGAIETLTTIERGEIRHSSPAGVDGNRAVLFTVHTGARDGLRVDVVSLQTGQRTALLQGNGAHALRSGRLLFERGGSLWVAPFDNRRLRVNGPPVVVFDGIAVGESWSPLMAIGADGSLAYGTGGRQRFGMRKLVWVDRSGHEQPIDAPSRMWVWPQISPDGRRLGLHFHDPVNMDAWIYELDHGPLVRVTYDPAQDGYPLWSPDGSHIAFWSRQGGGAHNLYLRAADLSGRDERLTTSVDDQEPFSWSGDGKLLVYHERSRDTGMDIGTVSIAGEHRAQLVIRGPADEARPAVSADGRWIAYQSNLSGRWQVYVQPFPELDARWQISTEGGASPTWSKDDRELFYRRGNAMMHVPIDAVGRGFRFGTANVLFEGPYVAEEDSLQSARNYDVAPDGERFVMIKDDDRRDRESAASQIVVVRNWIAELERSSARQ